MKFTERIFIYVLLILTSIIVLYPMGLIVISSLKTTPQFMGNPVGLPTSFSFENYIIAWEKANFGNFYKNSILVTSMSIAGITICGAMAAYGLRNYFRGQRLLFNFFLLGLMIPAQATIITTFIFLKQIHLLSTYTGLILVYMSHMLPLAIFIFSGFFKSIPKELEEAALLDGCSELATFWKIIIPISRPVIATVIILTGLSVWNDFFLPLILMLDQSKHTLPVGLLRLKGEFSINWPLFFSAMTMLMVPIIILFLFLQRQFIKGITSGAVKG
jgi:raffinose/stachyose/melibiose transport system permease protein